MPAAVLATQKDRLAVEQIGRESVAAQERAGAGAAALNSAVFVPQARIFPDPMPEAVRNAAPEAVDKQLVAAGLLSAVGGTVSPQAQKDFEVVSESCLPTAGVIVKGCIDTCDICEPELHRKIELELEEQALRNQLLKKQIELLEKSQEYRCCPGKPGPEA
jgi:hypothetical protein